MTTLTDEELGTVTNGDVSTEDKVYRGTFEGRLVGTATSAKQLETPFRLELQGDVAGNVDISGKQGVILQTKVSHATEADRAEYAGNTALAANANYADLANLANFAVESGKAEEAEHSKESNHAKESDHSLTADRANIADKALLSDRATIADRAYKADSAIKDNKGNVIDETYAVDKDLLHKDEYLTNAIIQGLATGKGTINETTLTITIDKIASGDLTIFEFAPFPTTEADRDTTKIYVSQANKHFYIFNTKTSKWENLFDTYSVAINNLATKLNADLKSTKTELQNSINSNKTATDKSISGLETNLKLLIQNNKDYAEGMYVKKTGDETIEGVKEFKGTVKAHNFIEFHDNKSGIGGGVATFLGGYRVADLWGQPGGADSVSLVHLRIKDYQSDDNLAYLQMAGNNQTKQGSITFNNKNLVRSVNDTNADINGNVTITSVANATKATQDNAGNVITNTYVKKTGDETISGVKTFTGTINTNGFIGFKSTQEGVGGGFANYINNNKVCDVWGQPYGADKISFIHLRIKDYNTDDTLAYLVIGGNHQTKQGSIKFNDKNLVRSVNGVNADINGNAQLGLGVYLVQSWVSGVSWYRVWSDGWCEQGSRSDVSYGNHNVITLLKAFKNTNYNVVLTKHDNNDDNQIMHAFLQNTFNTSNFIVNCEGANFKSAITWRACGYVTL